MMKHAFVVLLLAAPVFAHAGNSYLSSTQVNQAMAALPAPSAPGKSAAP